MKKLLVVASLVAVGTVLSTVQTVTADSADGPIADVGTTGVLSAGEGNTCYVGFGSALYCWGLGQYGVTGDTTFSAPVQKSPIFVSGGEYEIKPSQISLGDNQACALVANGKVKCWGGNRYGQTANGRWMQTRSGNPNEIHFLHAYLTTPGIYDENFVLTGVGSTLTGITQISSGLQFGCGVGSGGKVWCWGSNASGQTGNGDVTDYTATGAPFPNIPPLYARPVRDSSSVDVTGFVSVSAGELFACGNKGDGSVWCWGDNSVGQLGNGAGANSVSPVRVTGISGATAIATGARHACAVTSSGLKCWGEGDDARLGSARASGGNAVLDVAVPNATRVSAGFAHSCALDAESRLWCWGRFYNAYFEGMNGGPGTTTGLRAGGVAGSSSVATTPQLVLGLAKVKTFTSGNNHVCALEVDGPLKCWGVGTNGQLGNDAQASSVTPVVVTAVATQTVTVADPGTVRLASGTLTLDAAATSGVTPALSSSTESVCTVSGTTVTLKNVGTCTINAVAGSHAVYSAATASRSFTVGASAPTATTSDASGVTANSATLEASINARGASAAVTFELSTKEDMASAITLTADSADGVAAKSISKAATDLKPLTTYYFRAKATNDQGSVTGDVKSFKTLGSAPVATTGSASAQASKATLNGTVDPKGLATTVSFLYGLDPKLAEATTVVGTTQTGDGAKDVTVTLSGLAEKTTYFYRLVAANEVGKSEGDIKSFSTTKPEGVSINNGDEFTSSQKVTVSVTGPSSAVKAILSNDGGFATSETFDLTNNSAEIPWTLQSSKEGTFTKIVYVKYVSRFGSQSTPYTDDIILDTTKPVMAAATATVAAPTGSAVQVARVGVSAKKASGGVRLSLRGSDTISGIGFVEIRSAANKAPTKVKISRVAGKADGKPRATTQTVSLKTTAKRLQVRVIDRAGNASAWRTITVK